MLNLWIQRDDCMSKGNEDSISKIYLHSHNHHNTIHNSQDVETSQGPTNAWTDKEVMTYGLLLLTVACVRLFVTPWTAAHQASLSFTISQSLLKFMSIELVMPSNRLILCRPLLLLPSIFPSIRYAHTYKETLFSHENEGNPATCDNTDRPWGQYAK